MIVAVDVGGTFTDFVFLDEKGEVSTLKILSTPREPEKAVLKGLEDKIFNEVVHASTIGTNALLGQKGLEIPRVALFVTKGFRDIIEIGRQNRPRLYDLYFEKPRPLVPRELRFEINERTLYTGEILRKVDRNEISFFTDKAVEMGVVSVAVSFLHSYANPYNEIVAGEVLKKKFRYVTLSHEVAWEPREYERTSTAVVNAALMPVVSSYLEKLNSYIESRGAKLYVMSSSGGLVNIDEAVKRPVQIIESGPAGGVVSAAEFARLLGLEKVISFDMGGTTAKAGTVIDFEPYMTSEYEVGGESHYGRIVKGSGYPVRFPFIDLSEVSAGGGTIIWRDEAGALRVGPLSAGADPGPMCYGRGGVEPTITDANLILGRIPDYLLGGEMPLDKKGALEAMRRLGDPYEIAETALEMINLVMARGIRLVTVERGLDPADFVLIAFGGAGPQHAAFLAEELGIKRIIIPPMPGVFTALGMLMADFRFEVRKAFPKDPEETFQELENRLVNLKPDYFIRYADVRYRGQGWELTVPVGKPATVDSIRKVFEEKHMATYGFRLDKDIEIVVVRVFGVIKRSKPTLKDPPVEGSPEASEREVFFNGWVKASVFNREDLPLGYKIKGPVLIVEKYSTTVVPPRWEVVVGRYGVLEMRL
ncbi:MAG: hydantoinase/oxoprolinase family protein [Desulfurococcales archaeon]|nr:hydantoinase/oxoprolinase family protein [Desulfurococcales archaeon]